MEHHAGPTKAMIEIRLVADGHFVERFADELVDFLEGHRYEVIEVSKVKPASIPAGEMMRMYLKALRPAPEVEN